MLNVKHVNSPVKFSGMTRAQSGVQTSPKIGGHVLEHQNTLSII